MAKVSFSDLQVKRIRPPAKGQKSFWDSTLPGFGLRVSQGGAKTWIVVNPRSRVRTQETIGRYPVISLADARTEARRRLAEYTLGKHRPKSVSWRKATDEYLEEIQRTRKLRTHYDYKRMLEVHFRFRETPVGEITQHDIERRLGSLVDRPAEYRHAFSVARQFFNWAHRKHYVSTSPMARMRSPDMGKARERILSDEELVKVWKACPEDNFGRLVKALILLGQRRGEVSAIVPGMVEGDILTFPASLTKNGRTHAIPISDFAQSIVLGGTAWGGFSKSKAELDRRSGVTGWTLHDLRRTFASGLAGLGVALPIIEKLLNHVSGASFGGVAGVYQRYNFVPEMKAALEAWENKVCSLLDSHNPQLGC